MSTYIHLSRFLKLKRLKAGLTQADLAKQLNGIHSQFVSNWERGVCAPPNNSLPKMITVLRINREELVELMVADSRIAIEEKVYLSSRRKKSDKTPKSIGEKVNGNSKNIKSKRSK